MKLDITIIVADSDDPGTFSKVTFEKSDSDTAAYDNCGDVVGALVKKHLELIHGKKLNKKEKGKL